MAHSAASRTLFVAVSSRALLAARPEAAMLGVLLGLALLGRVVGLDAVEPNLLGSEAEHLRFSYRFQAGQEAGLLESRPNGIPRTAYLPGVLLGWLLGPSFVVPRLAAALGSALAIVAFYLVARQSLGVFASLAATVLLSFSGWLLFFSRNGELTVWVLPLGLLAIYFTRRGLERSGRIDSLLAGLLCGLGFSVEPSGRLVPAVIMTGLVLVALLDRPRRRAALRVALVVAAMTTLLALPHLPSLLKQQSDGGPTYPVGALSEPDTGRRPLPAQLLTTLRTFVLLDFSLPGNLRSIAPRTAVLDSFSGTLFFVGLLLAARRFRATVFWWSLFLWYALLQTPLVGVPDAGRALGALPAMALFAGLAIERLVLIRPFGNLLGLALTLAVPAAAIMSYVHYVNWQRSPANLLARQPGIGYAEFGVWRDLQLAAARNGQPSFDVLEWQNLRERYRDQIVTSSGTFESQRIASAVEVSPLRGLTSKDGWRKPRGVVAAPDGSVVVLEASGRLKRIESNGTLAVAFGPASDPPSDEVSDLALAPDGTLLVLDAGRALINRYGQDGRYLGALGADWGMYRPRGLTVAPDGSIYVADTGRNRVLVSHGGAPERELRDLLQPTDVAVDERGRVFVVEPEVGRLSVFDSEGREQARWDVAKGSTVEGPHLALLDGGVLAIAEPARRRVVFHDAHGRELTQIGGEGEQTLGLPYAVAAFHDRLYLADSGQSAVHLYRVSIR